ncbi:MAG: hypothetical protein A2075_17745 [Geobacteraceae bacterium GWC2_58_44]|nr:MAG: hypothetical protein A2075_17745 [Geobacteraceae bacterium GWC2_58_44]HBG04320.1 hypothetical protein [Geobacter sp.]
MKSTVFTVALIFSIGALGSLSFAADHLVRFDGGIGVVPVSSSAAPVNDNGTFQNVNRNDVRGVAPAGQPWVIARLKADIGFDGTIRVQGEGLLLSGGNNIGTAGNATVFATLFCDDIEHSSNLAGVPLEANGDFIIDDLLTPLPPAPCSNPVLLIRTANGGRWFAAGIPKD